MTEEIESVEKQDISELDEMADFYAKHYAQVYFVRCLKTDKIIAVECSPAKDIQGFSSVRAMRRDGMRDIYDYKGLFLTTRERLDKTPEGNPMIGYESLTGNDTRLSKYEVGVVEPVELKSATSAQAAMVLNPFEKAKMQSKVSENFHNSKEPCDYELKYNDKGMIIERFESFQIERVR